MDKRKAIEFLRESLKEIPSLAKLPYDNHDYPLWYSTIEGVLEKAFGQDSREYVNFHDAFSHVSWSGQDNQQEYRSDLKMRETALLSIIRIYEIVGIDTKSMSKAGAQDTAELPVYLFDKMQFHPRVIEASRGLFEDKHYAQAIFEAFKAVNNFVKKKAGKTQDGKDLMARAFNENAPIIKLNDLQTQSDKDEQEGFKFLFMGAMVGIRNPKAHDMVVQDDPYLTLQYLAFASLLLKKISFLSVEGV